MIEFIFGLVIGIVLGKGIITTVKDLQTFFKLFDNKKSKSKR